MVKSFKILQNRSRLSFVASKPELLTCAVQKKVDCPNRSATSRRVDTLRKFHIAMEAMAH